MAEDDLVPSEEMIPSLNAQLTDFATAERRVAEIEKLIRGSGLNALDLSDPRLLPVVKMARKYKQMASPDIPPVVADHAVEAAVIATLIMRLLEARLIELRYPSDGSEIEDKAQRSAYNSTMTALRAVATQYAEALKMLGFDPKPKGHDGGVEEEFKKLFEAMMVGFDKMQQAKTIDISEEIEVEDSNGNQS